MDVTGILVTEFNLCYVLKSVIMKIIFLKITSVDRYVFFLMCPLAGRWHTSLVASELCKGVN